MFYICKRKVMLEMLTYIVYNNGSSYAAPT